MSVILARNFGNETAPRKRTASVDSGFVIRKIKQSSHSTGKIGLEFVMAVMAVGIITAGAFYLFQVNSIAIQGYEVKEAENRIQSLEKENQKLKIQEVESRSMYNIEKSTENLNLISSSEISYIEVKGPMAMK